MQVQVALAAESAARRTDGGVPQLTVERETVMLTVALLLTGEVPVGHALAEVALAYGVHAGMALAEATCAKMALLTVSVVTVWAAGSR